MCYLILQFLYNPLPYNHSHHDEVILSWIDKKVDKINEDVEFIDATVDGLQIILDHKIKEDQLESEFIYTKIYIK